MRRRDFIAIIGGGAVASPFAARGLQAAKLPTIGFLGTTTAFAWSSWPAAFVDRPGQLGWIEGRSVVMEYRWAHGKYERFDQIAADFVQLKTDVIVAPGAAGAAV